MTTASEFRSVTSLVFERADSSPTTVAMRVLESGVWAEYGWADVARTVARVAALLGDAGVGPGGVVALVSGSRAEWPICVWAAQALGATTVAVSAQADEATIRGVAGRQPRAWITEGLEAYDRITDVIADAGGVLVLDRVEVPAGPTRVISWSEHVLGAQTSQDGEALAMARQAAANVDPDRPALMLPEDGAATFTHRDLLASDPAGGPSSLFELAGGDEYLSFLPPTWSAEASVLIGSHATSGATVSLGSRVGGGLAELAAVKPSAVQAPGLWWDALAERVIRQASEPAPLAAKALRAIVAGDTSGGTTLKLARRSIKHGLGLTRVRQARSLGPVSADTASVLRGLMVPLGDQSPSPAALAQQTISTAASAASNQPSIEGAS